MRRKYGLLWFAPMDCKVIQDWLDREAARGWELERAGLLLARFRRTERTDLRCCVDLTGRMDEDYLLFCDGAGWERVPGLNHLNIFKNKPGADPAPIHTEPVLELEAFRAKHLGAELMTLFNLPLWLVLLPLLLIGQFQYRWYQLLCAGGVLPFLLAGLLLLGGWTAYAVGQFRFWRRCKRAGRMEKTTLGGARRRALLQLGGGALLFALAVLALCAPGKRSPLGERAVVHHFGASPHYYCEVYRFAWAGLAERAAQAMAEEERTGPRLGPEYAHYHDPILDLASAELGFDRAWVGYDGYRGTCLVFRQGSTAVRLEGAFDPADPDTLAAIRAGVTENPPPVRRAGAKKHTWEGCEVRRKAVE